MTVVVDASAVVNVLIGWTPADVLEIDDDVVAPDHFLTEVASGLRRSVRVGAVPTEAASALLADALEMPVRLVSSRELVVRAFELRDAMTLQDACYVALAEERACALVTSDARLARAAGLMVSVTLV
jgi:predicted nucleic acid-binding protein